MALINRTIFYPTQGGTGDFTVAAAAQGYLVPTDAAIHHGLRYSYAAEVRNNDNSIIAWEVGTGLWDANTGPLGTLQRTPIFSSSGNAKVNFSVAPAVAISPLNVDFRERLFADRTYYVRKDGSDSNSGLFDSPSGAFLTLQGAFNFLSSSLDLAGFTVTFRVGPSGGTPYVGVDMTAGWIGGGELDWIGDTVTPSNVGIDGTIPFGCFACFGVLSGPVRVDGFSLIADKPSFIPCLFNGGQIPIIVGTFPDSLEFGVAGAHMWANAGGLFSLNGSYKIVGDATIHLYGQGPGAYFQCNFAGSLAKIIGALNISIMIACFEGAAGTFDSSTGFDTSSGSVTGQRYYMENNSIIKVGSLGQHFFPGTIEGQALTGSVYSGTLLFAQPEKLIANRTYYVRTDGSDSNDGLSNSAAGAFLTIQRAVDIVQSSIDFAGYSVTIVVTAGTYNAGAVINGAFALSGFLPYLTITGVGSTTIVSVTGDNCFTIFGYGTHVLIEFMKLQTTTSGNCIRAIYGGMAFWQGIEFGACAEIHSNSYLGGSLICAGNYSISGGAQAHIHASVHSKIVVNSVTVTLTGTPAFSSFFVGAGELSDVQSVGVTWSGSATGPRYTVNLNSVINTFGSGATYFPGNSAGSTATGGQYA